MSDRGRSAKDDNVTFGAAGSGLGSGAGGRRLDDAAGRPSRSESARVVNRDGRVKMTIDRTITAGLLRLFDLAGVAISGAASAWVITDQVAGWQLLLALLAAGCIERIMTICGMYRPQRLRETALTLGWGLLALSVICAALAAAVWLTDIVPVAPWQWLLAWGGLAALMLAGGRIVLAGLIGLWLQRGLWPEKVVVAGKEADAWRAATELTVDGDVVVVGVFADSLSQRLAGLGDIHVGHVDEAAAFCRENHVDAVILTAPEINSASAQGWMARLCELATRIELLPNAASLPTGTALSTRRMLVLPRPHSGWAGVVKGAEDRIIGGLILLGILPILVAIGIIIKLDSRGPALFRQERMGFDNKMFTVIKFRTMRVESGSDGTRQTRKDDDRVTRLGAFLRAKSLDELPQFLNVLKGEMSVVGPRPHPPAMLTEGRRSEEIVPNYARRHRVKPGITGWAQINGLRGATHTREQLLRRVAHDLEYIDNWSLWWDLRIVVRTVFTGFSDTSAY